MKRILDDSKQTIYSLDMENVKRLGHRRSPMIIALGIVFTAIGVVAVVNRVSSTPSLQEITVLGIGLAVLAYGLIVARSEYSPQSRTVKGYLELDKVNLKLIYENLTFDLETVKSMNIDFDNGYMLNFTFDDTTTFGIALSRTDAEQLREDIRALLRKDI